MKIRLLAALALGALLLLPFFLVDVPPVLDYPNHLARIFVLAHPGDPILSRFYAPHWRILPNLGFDVLGVALLKIFPVHVAGRMLLALSLLMPPLGVIAYSRAAFGRIGWWPLASALAAFNGVFFLGFMSFLLATGLALMAAAAWMILRQRSLMAAALAGAVFSALLFLCHVFGVLLFALLIGTQELANLRVRGGLRRWIPTGAALAVALAPALVLYRLSPLAGSSVLAARWTGRRKLWEIFTPFLLYSQILGLVTGLAVFGFLILIWRNARFAPGGRLALALLMLVFIAAPDSIKGGTFVDVRLALMLGLLLFACVEPKVSPRAGIVAATLFAALMLARTVCVMLVWQDHRADLTRLRAAIALVPPGAEVLAAQGSISADDRSGRLLPGLYRLDSHLPALLVIERRAFWPLLFADPGQQPLIVRPPYNRIADPLGEPPSWPLTGSQDAPYLRDWRRNFDNVLVIDPPRAATPVAGLIPLYTDDYVTLYRIAR